MATVQNYEYAVPAAIESLQGLSNMRNFNDKLRFRTPAQESAATQILESVNNPYDIDYYYSKILKRGDPLYKSANIDINNKEYQNYVVNTLFNEYAQTKQVNPSGLKILESFGTEKEDAPIFKFYNTIRSLNQPTQYSKNPNNSILRRQ